MRVFWIVASAWYSSEFSARLAISMSGSTFPPSARVAPVPSGLAREVEAAVDVGRRESVGERLLHHAVEVDVEALVAGRVGVRDVVRERGLARRRAEHRLLEEVRGEVEERDDGFLSETTTRPWVALAPASCGRFGNRPARERVEALDRGVRSVATMVLVWLGLCSRAGSTARNRQTCTCRSRVRSRRAIADGEAGAGRPSPSGSRSRGGARRERATRCCGRCTCCGTRACWSSGAAAASLSRGRPSAARWSRGRASSSASRAAGIPRGRADRDRASRWPE